MFYRLQLSCLSFFILLISFSLKVEAQDSHFSQFFANPMYLNPAFAGTARCPRLMLNYRDQWPNIPGTFVTYSAAYDQHIEGLNGGIGFMLMNDRAGQGTMNTLTGSILYSYQLPINKRFSLRFGAQASFFQKSVDWNKLTFGDMIDPRYGFIYPTNEVNANQTIYRPDFSTGILGFSKNYYFGVAVHHLFQPKENFILDNAPDNYLPRKYTVHGGYVFPLDRKDPEDGNWSPNIMYMRQREFSELLVGMYVKKGPIVGGMWYRHAGPKTTESFIFLVGLQTRAYKFGYSWDLTTSEQGIQTGGAHEVSLTMNFNCKIKRRKFRVVSCPQF